MNILEFELCDTRQAVEEDATLPLVGRRFLEDPVSRTAFFASLQDGARCLIPRSHLHFVLGGGAPREALEGGGQPVAELGAGAGADSSGAAHPPSEAALARRAPGPAALQHLDVDAFNPRPLAALVAARPGARRSRTRKATVREALPPLSAHAAAAFEAAADADGERVLRGVVQDPGLAAARHPRHGGTLLHAVCEHAGPVLTAAPSGDELAVRALVRAGCDPNARALNDSTPLHWAAGAGCLPHVRALVACGADVRARSCTWNAGVFGKGSGETAAHWAASSGHAVVLEELWGSVPEAAALCDDRDATPAEAAEKEGRVSIRDLVRAEHEAEFVCVRVRHDGMVHSLLSATATER